MGEGAFRDQAGPGSGGHDDADPLAHEVEGNLGDLAHLGQVRGERLQDRVVQGVLETRLQRCVPRREGQHLFRRDPQGVVGSLEVHDAFGEGARLVRAQYVHAPQVLDGVELPHDHAVAGHHPGPSGQVHAEDGGKQLRAQAHGQGDREEQGLDWRTPAEHVGREHEQHQRQHGTREQVPEVPKPAVELRFGRRLRQPMGHRPELGEGTRAHHQAPRYAAPHVRPEEDAVGSLPQGRLDGHLSRPLLHGEALPVSAASLT